MKSLIVEDEFAARRLLQIYLAPFGECDIAINGIEAVKIIEQVINNGVPYDLICLDINMPQMDGMETLKLIRQIEKTNGISEQRRARIIMTSSNAESKYIDGSHDQGCQAYLVKPIRKRDLLAEIERLGLIEQPTR